MQKKPLDWSKLGFAYRPTDFRYQANWKDGSWDEGGLVTDPNIVLSEAACVFHYAQSCFEGLKAYTTEDKFVQAVVDTVRANAAWVPPFGTGASLYIRPFMIGSGPQIGVAPAHEFLFRITVMPVGAYFQGAVKPLKVRVSDYDRAAPRGTGHVKAGLNYAMSLYPTMEAHRHGFAENIYLDPASRTYVEEAGGANVIFVDKDNNLIVPKSDSILPSITRRSLVYVGEHYLGLNVIERKVALEEVKDFKEAALCGTLLFSHRSAKFTPRTASSHCPPVWTRWAKSPASCVKRSPASRRAKSKLRKAGLLKSAKKATLNNR